MVAQAPSCRLPGEQAEQREPQPWSFVDFPKVGPFRGLGFRILVKLYQLVVLLTNTIN